MSLHSPLLRNVPKGAPQWTRYFIHRLAPSCLAVS